MALSKNNKYLLEQYFGSNLDKAKEILKANGNEEPYLTNRLLHLCWLMRPINPVQPRDSKGKFVPTNTDKKEN